MQVPTLCNRIFKLKFDGFSIAIIPNQFPGSGGNQDISCFGNVIGDTQFNKRRACHQEFPAIEYPTYMNRVDFTYTYSKFKVKVGVFYMVVCESLVNFDGTFGGTHRPLPLVGP